LDYEQLYVYGFQPVGHTNSNANRYTYTYCHSYSYSNSNTDSDRHTYADRHPNPDRYPDTNSYAYCHSNSNGYPNTDCHTNTYAAYDRTRSDVESAAGIDLYFFKRDFYLERGQRDRLFPFRGQFGAWSRYLQLWNSDGAFEDREQHSDGWTHDLRDTRFES